MNRNLGPEMSFELKTNSSSELVGISSCLKKMVAAESEKNRPRGYLHLQLLSRSAKDFRQIKITRLSHHNRRVVSTFKLQLRVASLNAAEIKIQNE